MPTHRRWPLFAVAALAATIVVVFPIRTQLAKAEFDRQARRWSDALAIDAGRQSAVQNLASLAIPGDESTVATATRSINRDADARIAAIRSDIAHERTPDHGVAQLRVALTAALAPVPQAATHDRAVRVLGQERSRFRRAPLTAPAPPHFAAEDKAMAALGRYVDEPTGAAIVTVSRATIFVFDIDRSTVKTQHVDQFVPFGFGPSPIVARRSYAAVAVNGTAFSVAPDLSRPPTPLGPADTVLAADQPDDVWLVRFDPRTDTSTETEVDGQGRPVTNQQAPRPVPDDPITPPTSANNVYDETAQQAVFSVIKDGTEVIELVDRSGRSTDVANPPGLRPNGCSFSPDGRRLACTFEPVQVNGLPLPLRLGIVDAATGTVDVVDGDAGSAPVDQIQWTAGGDRLFISTGATHPLATYRLGDSQVVPLRYVGSDVLDFVVLPAPS